MKIKTKKQLNLPQLIEWVIHNDINNTFAELKSEYPAKQGIQIDRSGRLHLVGMDYLSKNNTFTVEVEEEIMEDTEFKELICLDVDDKYISYDNVCVLDFDEDRVRVIYIPNDDLTMTLIWRKGKLVE